MPDTTKRAFESRSAAPKLHLAGSTRATPSLEEITPASYARLTEKERKEMVSKLIEFLKSV